MVRFERSSSAHPFIPVDAEEASLTQAGFRLTQTAHTSRTMMLSELSLVLNALPRTATKDAYAEGIQAENVAGKSTAATRRRTWERLRELYALDLRAPVFRALRNLWDRERSAQPLLALAAACARDSLLRATAPLVLSLEVGEDLPREALKDSISAQTGHVLGTVTLDRTISHLASSWQQGGFLEGRTFKKRMAVAAGPEAAALAAYVATLAGFRGRDFLQSGWIALLDASPSRVQDLLVEARKLGLLDYRVAGDLMSLSFDMLASDPRRAA
jgi:hypothetical protein